MSRLKIKNIQNNCIIICWLFFNYHRLAQHIMAYSGGIMVLLHLYMDLFYQPNYHDIMLPFWTSIEKLFIPNISCESSPFKLVDRLLSNGLSAE